MGSTGPCHLSAPCPMLAQSSDQHRPLHVLRSTANFTELTEKRQEPTEGCEDRSRMEEDILLQIMNLSWAGAHANYDRQLSKFARPRLTPNDCGKQQRCASSVVPWSHARAMWSPVQAGAASRLPPPESPRRAGWSSALGINNCPTPQRARKGSD